VSPCLDCRFNGAIWDGRRADARAEAQRILQAIAAQPAGQEPGVEAIAGADRVDYPLDRGGGRVDGAPLSPREGSALGALQHHHPRAERRSGI
jgi:hypothetical protein